MNTTFKDWFIRKHKEATPEEKSHLFWAIKFQPKAVEKLIASGLKIWSREEAHRTGKFVPVNPSAAHEIITALQEHFAKEIAEIKY